MKRLFTTERKRVVEEKRRMVAQKNVETFVIQERFGVFDYQLWFHLNIGIIECDFGPPQVWVVSLTRSLSNNGMTIS